MKFPEWLTVYGDIDWRGDCPTEDAEHVTLVNAIRRGYPKAAAVMVHVPNEGKRTAQRVAWEKARGMNTGASDFIFPGKHALVLEMKRRDHTKSRWQDGQLDYLQSAHDRGAMSCVALGWEAGLMAVRAWLDQQSR